jgi:signal transduction histidine kinase
MGSLLLLGFVPLYVAVATYTNVAIEQLRASHARVLVRALAREFDASVALDASKAEARLHADLAASAAVGLQGLTWLDSSGRIRASAGEGLPLAALRPTRGSWDFATGIDSPRGRDLVVSVRVSSGAFAALVAVQQRATAPTPLLRLLALYTALVGVAVLVLAYFALTYLIVRPLDELTRSAERVATGARRLTLPRSRARELSQLGQSIQAMTDKLLSEEEALRNQVAEVEAATLRLTEAQERLVRSERLASVGRLAAGLAHEIGNPIAALIGFEDLLLQGGLEPKEERDFLLRMRRDTERIHRILRDLLDFARPAAHGPERPRNEPGDVAAAIDDTMSLVAPQKEIKELELKVELDEPLPEVALPGEQLVQVLLNLVLNAADAVGPGGHVKISARRREARVDLVVEDDGPGVPIGIRSRLFEPFVTSKEPGKGTGLGLAVCRGLVEAAGGSITLDEECVTGARFVVQLPFSER